MMFTFHFGEEAYFESNGWKVSGKASMKDWQAALRNWHRNKEKFRKVR